MVYLIYGSPFFARRKIKDLFGGELVIFDLSEQIDGSIFERIKTQGLFSRATFVLKEFDKTLEIKEVEELLRSAAASPNCVIFLTQQVSENMLRLFRKYKAEIIEVEEPSGKKFAPLLQKTIRESGLLVTPEAKRMLLMLFRGNPVNFLAEIEKLKNIKEEITTAVLSQYIHRPPSSYFFEMIDAVLNNNKKEALMMLRREIDAGTSAVALLSAFVSYFRNLIFLKAGKRPKANPFVIKKLTFLKHKFTDEKLKNIYKSLADADFKIKTGKSPAVVLEDFILGL